ncbi:MAG UNVERIFIED_CONTAM: hypothetical protein LVR18_36010 [Planctomycetaceae bacterium]
MAKTWRHLFPLVDDWPNLVRAWQRCRRRKRYSPGAAEFAFDWESRLLQLPRDLEAGTWSPGDYEHFYISEPKPRKISAAPFADRVVHHGARECPRTALRTPFARRATRLQWQLQNRQIGIREIATSIRSWLSHADHANAKAVTRLTCSGWGSRR